MSIDPPRQLAPEDRAHWDRPYTEGGADAPELHEGPPVNPQDQVGGQDQTWKTTDGTEYTIHYVQPGETIWKLVHDCGMTMEEFYALNPQYKKSKQDGKLEHPNPGDDPDFIVTGDAVVLKPRSDVANTHANVQRAQALDGEADVRAAAVGENGPGVQEYRTAAAAAWQGASDAVDYELRKAYAEGGEAAFNAKIKQMKTYSRDGKYQGMVDDRAAALRGEDPFERNTNRYAYEVRVGGESLKRNPTDKVGQTDVAASQADFDRAVRDEYNHRLAVDPQLKERYPDYNGYVLDQMLARFPGEENADVRTRIRTAVIGEEVRAAASAGPDVQLALLKKRIEQANDPNLAASLYADPEIQRVVAGAVEAAYQSGGASAALHKIREITDMLPPNVAAKVIGDPRIQAVISKSVKDLNAAAANGPSKQANAAFKNTAGDLSAIFNKVGLARNQEGAAAQAFIVRTVAAGLDAKGFELFSNELLIEHHDLHHDTEGLVKGLLGAVDDSRKAEEKFLNESLK